MFFVDPNRTSQAPPRSENHVPGCPCTSYASFRPSGSNHHMVQNCHLHPRCHTSWAFGHGDRNVHDGGAEGATRSCTAGDSHAPVHSSLPRPRPVQTALIDGVHSLYGSGLSSPSNLLTKTTYVGQHLCEDITCGALQAQGICLTEMSAPLREKKIILHKWYLISCDGGHTSEVAVGGFLTPELLEKDRRKTGPIFERLEKYKIKTKDGFVVKLIGLIDEHTSYLNGFPFQMVYHFLSGFPYIWMHLFEAWSAENLRQSKCAHLENCCFDENIPIEAQEAQQQAISSAKTSAVEETLVPPRFGSDPAMNAEGKADSAVEEVEFDKSNPTMDQAAETGGGLIGDMKYELRKESTLPCLILESPSIRNDRPVRGKRKRQSSIPTEQLAANQISTCSKGLEKEVGIKLMVVAEDLGEAEAKEEGIATTKGTKNNVHKPGHCGKQRRARRSLGKRKNRTNIPSEQLATTQPSTCSKGIEKEAGIKPMAVGEDLVEAAAKDGGFAITNGSDETGHYGKQRKVSRRLGKKKNQAIPSEHFATTQPSTRSKDIEKDVGIKLMAVGEDLVEAAAKDGGFATTNGSNNKLDKPGQHAEQRKVSRSSGKGKRRSNIPIEKWPTRRPSTRNKENEKEVGSEPMVMGEDLVEDDAKEGGFATTNGSKNRLNKPEKYEKQIRASRSSILPPPLPTPRVPVSKGLISEAFGLKTSRHGRLLVPPLAFWRSQTLAHDMDGGIIAIMNGSEEPSKVDTGLFNFRPPNEIHAIKLQRRLCAAATEFSTQKKLPTGKKKVLK